MRECTIILFGATGNLSKRKIIPALYNLLKKNRIEKLLIIGAAQENLYPKQLLAPSKEFISDFGQTLWNKLEKITHYQQLDINNLEDFTKLKEYIEHLEQQYHMVGNRLLYCAVPATLFGLITKHSDQSGIITCKSIEEKPWQRIVYEKPFGHDYESAKKLNEEIHNCLNEIQVYRIDHYLAKELVANIALVRFTNRIFEPLWSHNDIESIEIILNEAIDIKGRGTYYDNFGALRDVVQNHMLELLALIAMEAPTTITGADLQAKRAEVLKNVQFDNGILGQYDSYRTIKEVHNNSKTETFVALKLSVNNKRWQDVPFYLKTGKCLKRKEKVIHINFKREICRLTEGCPVAHNRLTISIVPDAGFSLTLNAKKPDCANNIVQVKMEFCHECLFGIYTPRAYEIILQEVIDGQQGISVRFDEIEYSWKIIDEIYRAQLSLYAYQCGSNGPAEIKKFEEKNNMRSAI